MFEIQIITKEMDKIINREIVTYVLDENYIYMKNSNGYIFYFNKNFLREIRIRGDIKDDNSKI